MPLPANTFFGGSMFLRKLVDGIDRLNNAISSLSMWLILLLIAVMLLEVVLRYVFHSPTVWGAELSLMIFGTYMIYAGPSSVIDKVQVGVDIFSSRWSRRTQAIVSCITYVFTLIFFLGLIKLALHYGLESWKMKELSTSAWSQPIYHYKMLIPVAFILTCLQTLAEFLRNLWMALTGEEL